MNLFINIYIKFFVLLTPFFVLSSFLSITRENDAGQRRRVAGQVTVAVVIITLSLLFFGNFMFRVFDITLDAFRIGTGGLLFISAVSLVREGEAAGGGAPEGDVAVVPLAIPITVGPATTGALLVMGAEFQGLTQKLIGIAGLLAAVFSVGIILYLAAPIERVIGRRGIVILSKLTGLVLAALAAQIILTGIRNFLQG